MTWLLDGNLLVALRIDTHVSHEAAQHWFSSHRHDRFATCPVTQGTLLRVHMRSALDGSVDAAWQALSEISGHPMHEFWADNFSYLDVPHRLLQGPSQVTDAWLAELARRRKGKLATFDQALVALHRDVAELVPSIPE
jgi:toxin-antitoxin system PIN domain toxin